MKIKRLIVAVLIVVLAMSFAGCSSPLYKKMRADLVNNGEYSEKYDQYEIQLSGGVDYYCYGDSDKIWLSYYNYSGTNYRFYLVFDSGLDGEYTWYFYYDEYELRGELVASECNENTEKLSYDKSYGTDSSSPSINLALEKFAATLCKLCLTSLATYWIESDFDAKISDLGFDVDY